MAAFEAKKIQKAALGYQDSDEEDVENDIDEQIETLMASKRIVRQIQASALGPGVTTVTGPSRNAIDKLELAKRLASRINLKQGMGPTSALPETSIGAITVCCSLEKFDQLSMHFVS